MIDKAKLAELIANKMTPGMVWPVDEMLDTIEALWKVADAAEVCAREGDHSSRIAVVEALAALRQEKK